MAERRLEGLQRVLGVNALFSTAYGNVGSSIYYALGLVASFALGLTPVVFVITGVIFYLTAATYSEATAMYPEAGGSSSFARHAFNEFWSFFAAWGQMLNYVITISISAFFVPHYIGGLFWEPLRSSPGDILFGIGVIALLCAINVVGVKEAAGLNIGLALADFMTQVLLVVIGGVLVFSPETLIDNVNLGVAPTWHDFLIAIPIGMIAYTGIETISNMAEEARDQETTIPRAINRVVIAVFTIYAALPAVALSALPVTKQPNGDYVTKLGVPEDKGGFAGDPILGVVKSLGLGPLQHAGEIYVGLLAATILIIATNAGILGVSRLVYSMGLHRQLPDRLRQLHPRFRTPWIGILLFGLVACVTLVPGQAVFLGNLYAFGAMLSFTIAHLSVIALRVRRPDEELEWRARPNLTIRGVSWPLFAIVGALGTGIAWLVVVVQDAPTRYAGTAWLAVGLLFYVLYRRRLKLPLRGTSRAPVPLGPALALEYRSILVPIVAGPESREAVEVAARLATERAGRIVLLRVIVVPLELPLDADLTEQVEEAHRLLDEAYAIVEPYGVRAVERVVRARQAGRAIVEEADRRVTEVVVLGARRGGYKTIFGATVEYVLKNATCRVMVAAGRKAA